MSLSIYPHLKNKKTKPAHWILVLLLGTQTAFSGLLFAQSKDQTYYLQTLKRSGYVFVNELNSRSADSVRQLAFSGEELQQMNYRLPPLPNLEKLLVFQSHGNRLKIDARSNPVLSLIEIKNHRDQLKSLKIHCPSLKTLQIYESSLKDLYRLKQTKQLNRILISNCKLEKVSLQKLKRHPSLRELSLMFDSLKTEQVNWSPMPRLIKLNLTGNLLYKLPPGLERWDSLQDLNFARNKFKEVAGGHPLPPGLKSLSFYDNALKTLPPDMVIPKQLEILDLYYNQMKELPEVIGKFKSLKILYASFNEIQELPEWLSRMDSLKALYVHHNKITLLPQYLSRLKGLEVLHVNSNYLLHCPEWVGEFELMNDLDLANNLFETLPLSLKKLEALEVINLRGNPFPEGELSSGPVFELLKHWRENDVQVVR